MCYRLYRLRRLVILCVVAVLTGLAAGASIAGSAGPLAQPGALVALFIVFGGALVAMALYWPHDIGGTLTYAVGTAVMLAAVIPFSIYMTASNDRQGLGIVLAVMFGPLIWLVGAPLIGAGLLFPLDRMIRRNYTSTSQHHVPMPLDIARARFASGPDTQSLRAMTGPVGRDGFWEERSVSQAPDPKDGKIVSVTTVVRVKELDADALSQSVMALPQMSEGADPGIPTSLVFHIAFSPDGAGTRMTRHINMDRISQGRLFTMWLCDGKADIVMAECDAFAGHAPRALIHLPTDNIWTTLQRFFRWDDRPLT
jgi:hypothetical protein